MTLQDYTNSLSKDQQFKVGIHLIRLALPIWYEYANHHSLRYRDTTVDMPHSVDRELLANTINEVETYHQSSAIKKLIDGKSRLMGVRTLFDDPVTALQEADLDLPDAVLKIFYAVYDLIDALLGKEKTAFGDPTIYISISQAIEALEMSKMLTSEEIDKLLLNLKNE